MLSNIYAITVTVKYGYAGMDKYGWRQHFSKKLENVDGKHTSTE